MTERKGKRSPYPESVPFEDLLREVRNEVDGQTDIFEQIDEIEQEKAA